MGDRHGCVGAGAARGPIVEDSSTSDVDVHVSLRVGDRADLFLARHDAPELTPGHVLDNLVYAASGSVVHTTVIAGRVVMHNRVIDGEAEVRAKVVESAPPRRDLSRAASGRQRRHVLDRHDPAPGTLRISGRQEEPPEDRAASMPTGVEPVLGAGVVFRDHDPK